MGTATFTRWTPRGGEGKRGGGTQPGQSWHPSQSPLRTDANRARRCKANRVARAVMPACQQQKKSNQGECDFAIASPLLRCWDRLSIAIAWGIRSYGFYHGVAAFWHGGSVLVVLGCIVSVLGRQAIFRFLPVVAVLVFLVPVPGEIRLRVAIPLQTWTAQIEQQLFHVLNIEVSRTGNQLWYNGKPIDIIEKCNGLRMVFGLILVSYAFSFSLPLRNWVRILILLLSPLAAILCNLIRILPTVWVYGTMQESFADRFHLYSGWLMLLVALLMLLGILRIMRWAMIPVMRFTLAN